MKTGRRSSKFEGYFCKNQITYISFIIQIEIRSYNISKAQKIKKKTTIQMKSNR